MAIAGVQFHQTWSQTIPALCDKNYHVDSWNFHEMAVREGRNQ